MSSTCEIGKNYLAIIRNRSRSFFERKIESDRCSWTTTSPGEPKMHLYFSQLIATQHLTSRPLFDACYTHLAMEMSKSNGQRMSPFHSSEFKGHLQSNVQKEYIKLNANILRRLATKIKIVTSFQKLNIVILRLISY